MKKLITMLFIIFPFVAMGQTQNPGGDLKTILYDLKVTIEGVPDNALGGAKTVQVLDNISWGQYTVTYTVLVDAIREILSKAWVLDSVDLPPAKVQEYIDNPQKLLEE